MKEQKEQDLQKKLDQLGNNLKQAKQEEYAAAKRKYKVISALCSVAGAVVMAMILFGNVDDMSDAILIPLLLANMIAGAVWGGTMGDKEVEKGFFYCMGKLVCAMFAVSVYRDCRRRPNGGGIYKCGAFSYSIGMPALVSGSVAWRENLCIKQQKVKHRNQKCFWN